MKDNIKRIILVALSVCIVLSTATINAFGEDENDTTTTTTQPSSTTTTTTTTTPDNSQPTTNDNKGESTTVPVEDEMTIEEAEKMLEEQRQDLAQKIKDAQAKLEQLEATSKDTEEYINALDEKIGYINEELTVLDGQVATAQAKVDALQLEIEPLEKEIKILEAEYTKTKTELENLNREFKDTYDAYCLRMRAMYISGETSIIAILLSSGGISQLLSRYEMIQAITKSDAQLLDQVNHQMDDIITKQDGLNNQKETLYAKTTTLIDKQNTIKLEQQSIENKQEEIAQKKVSLALDRAESDRLLAEYTAKTQMHTEFRHEDEELLAQVNKEIDNLLNGLIAPGEVTTAVSNNNQSGETTTSPVNDNNKNTLYSNSNAVLNMTYPVPNHYSVSLGYGYYSDGRPHPAIDFPLETGAKVVAAQKGIVISVERLNYSYGHYIMIYHGTDAQGRKVVTLYAHNSEILVSPGQSVAKGQQIAKGGSTGNSTGPHCHFELRLDNKQVNPANYLSK